MNDPELTPDTAEQMLHGHPTGPEKLRELLAAASSDLTSDDLPGEEAAVAAFRAANHRHSEQPPNRRHIPVTAVLKVALTALTLLLAGTVATAATEGHPPAHAGTSHPSPPRHRPGVST